MGLDVYLDKCGEDEAFKEQIPADSKLYPEHLFKIGYFRSSYNGSGINLILLLRGFMCLYQLFDYSGDHVFQPNWRKAKENTVKTIADLRHHIEINSLDLNWYVQALEIVGETIDFVLSRKDMDKLYLYWWG